VLGIQPGPARGQGIRCPRIDFAALPQDMVTSGSTIRRMKSVILDVIERTFGDFTESLCVEADELSRRSEF
jgi:hypothetical protein